MRRSSRSGGSPPSRRILAKVASAEAKNATASLDVAAARISAPPQGHGGGGACFRFSSSSSPTISDSARLRRRAWSADVRKAVRTNSVLSIELSIIRASAF